MTHDEVMNAYLAEKDPRKGIPILVKGVIEMFQQGKVTDAIDVLNIGHIILVKSEIQTDENPYVKAFAKLGIYCWVCDRFMATADARTLVCQCVNCRKTFCPSHAERTFFSGTKCPLCKGKTPVGA
jgi:hypothetical protein